MSRGGKVSEQAMVNEVETIDKISDDHFQAGTLDTIMRVPASRSTHIQSRRQINLEEHATESSDTMEGKIDGDGVTRLNI